MRRAVLGVLAAVALVTVVLVESQGPDHQVRAVFAAALQVRPGQEVRVAGRTVGSVQSIALWRGSALVTLGIDDSQWPLHAGTTATLRFGAAAAYASRYVQLTPGPPGTPALVQNALIPERDTITPVEFDQIYATFGLATRRNLGGTITGAAKLLGGHARDLARDLGDGGTALRQTAAMLSDLGLDPAALGTLLTAGASATAALRASDRPLQGLVSNAAQTFSVLADNAGALGATLHELPVTLTRLEPTLAHLDRSLGGLDTLVRDIAPGAAALVTTAPRLTATLQTLDRIGPLARSTLAEGVRELPVLGRFLDVARPFLPGVTNALARLAPMVACLRPYAPEIGGWLETWQGGAIDHVGHYGRVAVVETPVGPGTKLTPAQAVAQSGGTLQYAFPRPPGLNAGQPWFQPRCGAGPSALNPAGDPEASG
jgi:phospholipid/cholesterol/gamma-HCH transport system substrate-binding protein